MSTIAERLLRVRGSIKQGKFAASLGVNPNTLRGYESGRTSPNFDFLAQVCVIFSVNPAWLLLGVGPEKNEDVQAASSMQERLNCLQCLEVCLKLIHAQEEGKALLKENFDLKAQNKELHDRLVQFLNENKNNMANTA